MLKLIIRLLKSLFCVFVLNYNEFLDKCKFNFNSVKKCKANDYNKFNGTYTTPCTKYTYDMYCKTHAYLLRISCEMYHYLGDPRIANVPLTIREKAEVELKMRLRFCERFSIKSDYGHEKWNEKLRGYIYAENFEKTVRESKKEVFLHNITHATITNSIDSLSRSLAYLTLEPGNKYVQKSKSEKKNNIDNDWSDSDDSTSNETKQCDKSRKNLFLFNHYFNRSKLNDSSVAPLNLSTFQRKEQEDEW